VERVRQSSRRHCATTTCFCVEGSSRRFTKLAGLQQDLGIHLGRTVQLLQCRQGRSTQSSQGKCAASPDKCCSARGSALQSSKDAWAVLDHPEDHLSTNFQAHSKFLPSDTKQRLKIAAAFLAAVWHFTAFGFRTLGLGRSSASITSPHVPTAKKSFFLMCPLSAVFLGDLVTNLFSVQMHCWEALFPWIFSPKGFIQVLFTVFHLLSLLGYLLKHH